jgi:hypothetical protein
MMLYYIEPRKKVKANTQQKEGKLTALVTSFVETAF